MYIIGERVTQIKDYAISEDGVVVDRAEVNRWRTRVDADLVIGRQDVLMRNNSKGNSPLGTGMLINDRIERFAKQVLGCACPDEVFEHIEYRKIVGDIALRKITIGDRLLIYLADFDGVSSPERLVETTLRDGIAERNERGLNRFRLVLLTADPEPSDDTWQAMLRASPDSDDKVHLHMVDVKEAKGL